MAASGKVIESPRKLNLRPLGVESNTERGDRFWNRNVVEMKFSVEHDWMKRVRFAESKPNYGMRDLDPVLEELTGNKLELIGPMLDGFIKEIGLSIHAKLGRSSKSSGIGGSWYKVMAETLNPQRKERK